MKGIQCSEYFSLTFQPGQITVSSWVSNFLSFLILLLCFFLLLLERSNILFMLLEKKS